MLWSIIKKEFLNQVLRSQFIFSTAIILILVILGLGMLLQDYAEDVQNKKDGEAIHRSQMEEAEELRDILRSFRVERAISPLRPIATGIERESDLTVELGSRGVTGTAGSFDKNPIYSLFPRVDLVFIIGVFLSLMVFLLSYDSISGEKEEGTLRLVFSYNVPRDTFLLGKFIGGMVSLSVPILAGFAAAAVLLVTSPSLQLEVSDWLAFLGVLVVSFLYLSLTYTVGLFVSCRSQRSSTAISVLLFVWVVFVLIVPNAMPYLAALLRPIDPPSKIQERVSAVWARVSREFWTDVHRMRSRRQEEGFDWRERRRERENQRDADYAEERESIIRPYARERAQFARLAQGLSRLSPFASYTYASTRLAQTGPEQEPRVDQSLERLRKGLANVEAGVRSGKIRSRTGDGKDLNLGVLPKYQFQWEELMDRLAGAAVDAALLFAGTVIFFLGTFVSFLRMDLVN